jgi:uncharacterized protein (DUF1697 family)
MPKLRALLEDAGFGDVATYLQSGNVVVSTPKQAEAVRREVERLIAEMLGLEIDVVVRSRGSWRELSSGTRSATSRPTRSATRSASSRRARRPA